MLEHKSVNISFSYSDSFEFADKNKTSDEYEYDANGNLTKDMNKGISEITYDACNQPRTIKFDGGKLIKYVYSVDGRKLSVAYISPLENLSNASANAFTATFDAVTAVEEPKLVSGTGTFSTVSSSQKGDTSSPSKSGIEASANKMNLSSIDKIVFVAPELEKAIGEKINLVNNISVTEYVGNFILENGNLTTYLTDDGYMSFTSAGKPEFHYYIKDHLGSIRVVCDRNGNAEQVNHYYPYGGLIGDLSTDDNKQKYRYKYNGKEFDRMHGLDTYD
ncbi:MAG: hypothetical protein KBS94_05270, partial [Prevotella sp.]|nr:hypothetical protein [Candidatus Equicola faecalis]